MSRAMLGKFFPFIDSEPSPSQQDHQTGDNGSDGPDSIFEHGIISAEKVTRANAKAAGDVKVDQLIDQERPNEEAQHGVTTAEAITLSWTKTSLGTAYIL